MLTNPKLNGTKVLWTNPSPNGSFSAQTIILNSGDFDVYEIFFRNNSSDSRVISVRSLKGKGTELGYSDNSCAVFNREVSYNTGDKLQFTVGKYLLANQTGSVSDNTRCIPLYIIGYKTGLF